MFSKDLQLRKLYKISRYRNNQAQTGFWVLAVGIPKGTSYQSGVRWVEGIILEGMKWARSSGSKAGACAGQTAFCPDLHKGVSESCWEMEAVVVCVRILRASSVRYGSWELADGDCKLPVE